MSRFRYLALVLLVLAGCTPSDNASNSEDFTNVNARFQGNVSEIYGLVVSPSGPWSGIDVQWKDSTGVQRSLSGYYGKPILLSFWRSIPDTAAWQLPTLDSVQAIFGDSVRIVSIADPNLTNSYAGILNYITTKKIRQQIIVDSLERAHIQYAQTADGRIGWPETFVIKPSGRVMTYLEGYASITLLDSLVRAAYR